METFTCVSENPRIHKQGRWASYAKIIREMSNVVEAMVEGWGTYMNAIIDKYYSDSFIRIPNLSVGCDLSSWWEDIFWSTERLSNQMNKVGTITAACAFNVLMHDLHQSKEEAEQGS